MEVRSEVRLGEHGKRGIARVHGASSPDQKAATPRTSAYGSMRHGGFQDSGFDRPGGRFPGMKCLHVILTRRLTLYGMPREAGVQERSPHRKKHYQRDSADRAVRMTNSTRIQASGISREPIYNDCTHSATALRRRYGRCRLRRRLASAPRRSERDPPDSRTRSLAATMRSSVPISGSTILCARHT